MPTTAHITAPAAAPETPAAYLAAYEKFDHLVSRLRSVQTQRMTHSALEQLLETEGRELLRRLLQAHLAPAHAGHRHRRSQRRGRSGAHSSAHTEAGVGERLRDRRDLIMLMRQASARPGFPLRFIDTHAPGRYRPQPRCSPGRPQQG